MPPEELRDYLHLTDLEASLVLGVSRQTILKWRKKLGVVKSRNKVQFPPDIIELARTRTLRDLANYLGWKDHSNFSRRLRAGCPEAHTLAIANSRAASAANLKRMASEPESDPFDFSQERAKARISRAMRHLQGVRLGPCYPWKNGYYWMGKCLDEAALMAEAQKWGWVA